MKYMILIILLLCTTVTVEAQVYIQGKRVISLPDIVTSELLPSAKRLSMDEAFKINQNRNHITGYTPNLVGEFWLIDSLLINVVSRTTLPGKKDDYEQLKYGFRPEGAGLGNSYDGKYYDAVKSINNYETLIHYYRTHNNKYFEIQDNQGRYKLSGVIISTKEEMSKAEAFMDILLKSITFK
jgi:hypothetical protein